MFDSIPKLTIIDGIFFNLGLQNIPLPLFVEAFWQMSKIDQNFKKLDY